MDKKEIIMVTALRLFVENGFHGTPTSKIAKEAGVANGTLFHYFNTKEDLIVSLYLSIKTKMGNYVDKHAKPSAKPKEQFKDQFVAVIDWALENRDDFYYAQLFTTSPFASLLSPEDVRKQLKKSCDQIQHAIDTGAIKNRDTDFIHTIMASHVFGLYTYLNKNKLSKAKQKQVIEDSFEMLWGMLA